MIVKTKANPLGSLTQIVPNKTEVNNFSELVKETTSMIAVLPKITERSLLDNSSLITLDYDRRTASVPITGITPANYISNAQKAVSTNQNVLSLRFGAFVINPLGIYINPGAAGAGIPSDPRVSLALPTTKLAKFYSWDTDIMSNLGLVSARSIKMVTETTTQKNRLAYYFRYTGILAYYQALLNRIATTVDYIREQGPVIGLDNTSNMLFNDEEVQRILSEIFNNIKDYPMIDVETHDRLNALTPFTLSKAKTFKTQCIDNNYLLIAAGATNLTLGSTILGAADDSWYSATVFKTTTASLTNVLAPFRVTDYLFVNDLYRTTAKDNLIKAELTALATHSRSIRDLYAPLLQMLRFCASKGWVTPSNIGSMIKWSADDNGNISIVPSKLEHSWGMDIIKRYAPIPLFIEGTGNNAWARIDAPLLLNTAGAVHTSSIYGTSVKYVPLSQLASGKGESIDELASWGLWTVLTDTSTAADDSEEGDHLEFINPYDGLMFIPGAIQTAITNAPAFDVLKLDTSFVIEDENIYRLNTVPLFIYDQVAGQTFWSTTEHFVSPDSDHEILIAVNKYYGRMKCFYDAGYKRYQLSAINAAGTATFCTTYNFPQDDMCYTEINILDFFKSCIEYNSDKPLPVSKTITK